MLAIGMVTAFGQPILAGRGRALAYLIEGLSSGDPICIGIVVVIAAVIVGYYIIGARSKSGND